MITIKKSEHVTFLQDFIVWPKCFETETTKIEMSRDWNGQTETARPKSPVLCSLNCKTDEACVFWSISFEYSHLLSSKQCFLYVFGRYSAGIRGMLGKLIHFLLYSL